MTSAAVAPQFPSLPLHRLLLKKANFALKLLQRVRDESHRFANTYNAQLRLKRISESILDEFPNIGERRKAALLKKFGSIQRIRMATVEQIAEVSGFGGKGASELKAFLEARSNVSSSSAEAEAATTLHDRGGAVHADGRGFNR